MPLINNDDLGRRIVRIGKVLGIGGAALAIIAVLLLIAAVILLR
ncbi:hypothetical protein [Actinoplanes sp. ATCC 53533]|nr:hypothetical protein [Actinoplanes sp. ATCC 53533]